MSEKPKPLVYLAGPYTKGDQALNVRSQLRLFLELQDHGKVIPYAPLFSHFAQFIEPKSWDYWMDHSYQMILKCDAVLRRPAMDGHYYQYDSRGADLEIAFAHENKIPIFTVVEHLYQWSDSL